MAVIEQDIVFTSKDGNGNTVVQYPLTTVEQVDGGVASVNGNLPDADGNVEIDVGGFPVGFEYFQTNPNIQAGSLPLVGGLFSREIYSDLWEWVQKQNGYLITEAEWQALYVANSGAVPYYSDGDGSTTFRVPALSVWCKGAESIEEIGNYLADSFASHKHDVKVASTGETASAGAHTHTASTSSAGEHTHTLTVDVKGNPDGWGDYGRNYWNNNWASTDPQTSSAGAHTHTVMVESNGAHTHSVTITNKVTENAVGSEETRPKTIVGIYCVIAYGRATNSGSVDLDDLQQMIKETQELIRIQGAGVYVNHGESREREATKPDYGLI